MLTRHAVTLPAGIKVFEDSSTWPAALRSAGLVLLGVSDDVIGEVARDMAPHLPSNAIVLHLSGLRDKSVLRTLEGRVAALGSFHPLQSLVDPNDAPARLRGATAALEGDPAAVAAGDELARQLGMQSLEIRPDQKAAYHAASALVSNGAATLAKLAEDLLSAAGIRGVPAKEMLGPLLKGTAENVARFGAGEALTGPVRRGDAVTVQTHLDVLPANLRPLYLALARETLRVARRQGLETARADEVARVLDSSILA